jgi:predicted  nucleic acid-binding Zn-ribbon protein
VYDDDDEAADLTLREYRALLERLEVLEESDDDKEEALSDLRKRLSALEMRGTVD